MLKKISKNFIIFLFFASVLCLSLHVSASLESFIQRMQNVIQSAESKNQVIGIEVVSLDNNDILFQHRANSLLNPASCTKIITTAAALKLLGPNYRFNTKFYTDVKPANGKVMTLWVKGYGDPSIVIENLWKISRNIANTGLKEIKGDIIIDDFAFDNYLYPGYWIESSKAYNTLTGAVSLNFNTVTVVITPSSNIGYPPMVSPDTAGPYFRIVNSAKTGPRDSKMTISVSRNNINNTDTLIIKGSIPVHASSYYVHKNITNPPIYFGYALKSLLEQNGVIVKGNVRRGRFPGGSFLLLENLSKPLSLIVRDMNKYSNNFIAEQIVKVLGLSISGEPGSTEKGIDVIKNYLSHIGIPETGYTLVNGSGLTSANRISASILTAILADLYRDDKIRPEFLSSLSIAGIDGTAKDRIISDRLQGLARAKTGTLNGVSTLTGIVPNSTGETLGYAILMNGKAVIWGKSHEIQERFLNAMSALAR